MEDLPYGFCIFVSFVFLKLHKISFLEQYLFYVRYNIISFLLWRKYNYRKKTMAYLQDFLGETGFTLKI
jgi:hypothetical protein